MNRLLGALVAIVALTTPNAERRTPRITTAFVPTGARVEQSFSSALHGGPRPNATQRKHGLDPASSLASRVRPAPQSLLEQFSDPVPPPEPPAGSGQAAAPPPRRLATTHVLSDAEHRTLVAALDDLAPLHRRVLSERLRAFYFVDAPEMPGTALTMPVDGDGPFPLFDVMFRGSVFRETVSEWLTAKERGCFDATNSTLSVSVEAGAGGAVRYALLHEATHVTDLALALTPAWRTDGPSPDPASSPFTRGVWKGPREIAAQYADPLLKQVAFRPGVSRLSIARAAEVYMALARTPFVSLYASTNWSDDLAELVTVWRWANALHQPFRVVVRDRDRDVFTFEPMASALVRQRVGDLARFDDAR